MPASIPVSAQEKEWLKKLIYDKYKIELVDSYACQQLCAALEKDHISISYNTIRRLFGIIIGSPDSSRFTLNTFAKSLGFETYTDFQAYVASYNTDYINEIWMHFRLTNQIEWDQVEDQIKHFTFDTWAEAYQLKSMIELTYELKNWEVLAKILKTSFLISDEAIVHYRLYVAVQMFYLEARKNNQQVIQFIVANANESWIIQSIIFGFYVDEEYLNGFCGDWLEACTSSLATHFTLFRNLLLLQKAVNNQDEINIQYYYQASKNTYDAAAHPVLQARFAAWTYILDGDDKPFQAFTKDAHSFADTLAFTVFFYRLTYTYGKNITDFDFIERIDIDQIPIAINIHTQHNLNKLYILQAHYWHAKNNRRKARYAIDLLNPKYIISSELDWCNAQIKYLKSVYA